MADKKFKRFGRYLILDHLVDGGMAKICRARFLGEQANKVVAIKMVQPQFSQDPAFVKMFEDELKVTFSLQHPNIAQVNDYGIVDGQLFTAMEYVDGANLKQFLDRLKENKYVFPVEISTYIISQVCQALHYAHNFTDSLTGKKFNIIHRDISPHNIMLTFDGAVKVIDFGIAKADSNSEATQAGTIKGKLSYLAPEYLEGLELDHRYDMFSVGITLWEMLCSRKLFQAKNDLAVLKLIQNCKIPAPSSINPNVPKELDEIVLKALQKNRVDRYKDMEEFNRALIKFLYAKYPDFNASDLSYFAKELFKAEIADNQQRFREYGKIDIRPYLEDMSKDSSAGNAMAHADKTQKSVILDLSDEDSKINLSIDMLPKEGGDTKTTVLGDNSNRQQKAKSYDSNNSSRDLSIVRNNPSMPRAERTGTGIRRTNPRMRRTQVTQQKSGGSGKMIAMIAVIAIGYFYKDQLISRFNKITNGNISGNRTISSTKKSTQETGRIVITGYEVNMNILVNGKKVDFNGVDVEVPINKNIEIKVVKKGHMPFAKSFMLASEDDREYLRIPLLKRIKMGVLSTSLNYEPGSKIIYKVQGERVEKNLPLYNERIPTGTYDAIIENEVLGTEKSVQFTIEENKKHFLK